MIDSSQNINHKGSSTFIIVTIDKNENFLHSSNIGDSGYMIFRLNNQSKLIELMF